MKKSILSLTAGLLLFGCADKKAQEQSLLDSVIKVHEVVMGADEQLLKNKTALDSLVKINPPGSANDSAKLVLDKVVMADSAMDTWMHNFNPDLAAKPHDENMSYLAKQKKLIMQVDSQMKAALNVSGEFIAKTKKK